MAKSPSYPAPGGNSMPRMPAPMPVTTSPHAPPRPQPVTTPLPSSPMAPIPSAPPLPYVRPLK